MGSQEMAFLYDFLTKNSVEFGSRLVYNSLLLILAFYVLIAINLVLELVLIIESVTQEWYLFGGEILIAVLWAVAFWVVYFRKDQLLLLVVIEVVVIIVLCVAGLGFNIYGIVLGVSPDTSYSWYDWAILVISGIPHSIYVIIASLVGFYVFKLHRVTRDYGYA